MENLEFFNLMKMAEEIGKKKNLMNALANVTASNPLLFKDDQRDKGKEYTSSDKVLASVQKPFMEQGLKVLWLKSEATDKEFETLHSEYRGTPSKKSVKACKARSSFVVVHIESGEAIGSIHEANGVADQSNSEADALEGAKTRTLKSFIQGLLMVPRLSRSDLQATKQTVSDQHKIGSINAQVKAQVEAQKKIEAHDGESE